MAAEPTVLGVSGSAVEGSNTDRAVQAILDATGCRTEFVKLSDYTVAQCTACLGCAEDNRCVIEDDGIALAEKARDADALVIGGYTPYSMIDARTKTFMERLYPLHHKKLLMSGKPGAAVVTHSVPEGQEGLPPAGEMGLSAIQFYMMAEGMEFVGGVKILGNVPCLACGFGNECETSGLRMMHGEDATVESVGINSCADDPAAMERARELGQKIAEALERE